MNILLLSAYDAESHKSWRQVLVSGFPEHHFTQLVLSPRFFSWRIRGNSLSLAHSLSSRSERYDLIIATSMVDLSTLIGLLPRLGSVPSILYFHENQPGFPNSKHSHQSIEPSMVNIYAAMAATKLCFNSRFNYESFCEGTEALLSKFPDEVPAGIVSSLKKKSAIVPVPLARDVEGRAKPGELSPISGTSLKHAATTNIVWNHRWEYDKGPRRLLKLLELLPPDQSVCFHILGQQFRSVPDEMLQIKVLLQERGWLGNWGRISMRREYLNLLLQADIVLSTAIQEFQGLSVLEAMALNCIPVVPNRLAYPEYVASKYLYSSHMDEELKEASSAANLLQLIVENKKQFELLESQDIIDQYSWEGLRMVYKDLFASLVDKKY